jgi:hypothetical protein
LTVQEDPAARVVPQVPPVIRVKSAFPVSAAAMPVNDGFPAGLLIVTSWLTFVPRFTFPKFILLGDLVMGATAVPLSAIVAELAGAATLKFSVAA